MPVVFRLALFCGSGLKNQGHIRLDSPFRGNEGRAGVMEISEEKDLRRI